MSPQPTSRLVGCKACGQPFISRYRRQHCPRPECQRNKSPAVYRFVCPDGRSYVGAVGDSHRRGDIQRSNPRLLAAFELHPSETWTFEVLERLPSGCSKEALREAEQHHIDRLRSGLPEFGFNMAPAVWTDGPAQCADGIPPPVSFSLQDLPDDALLTEPEAAAVGRWSTNSLTAWRRQPNHPLRWELVAGKFIRYRAGDLKIFMALPRRGRGRPPGKQPSTADQQKIIRELSKQLREARQKRPDNVGTDST